MKYNDTKITLKNFLDTTHIHETKIKSENISIPSSIIKWTGSKRAFSRIINNYFPEHFNSYYEPFLGGGSILYTVDTNKKRLASDIYEPLIELWKIIRDNPLQLVLDYAKRWNMLQENFPDYYYIVRNEYNNNKDPLRLNFLMRTCVNGIARFNSKGEFNNSFHLSRKGMKPERFKRIVFEWYRKLQGVNFIAGDYRIILKTVKDSDFVYLDPPYFGNKDRYINSGFNFNEFINFLRTLNEHSVKWAVSLDGSRGEKDYSNPLPDDLYKHKYSLSIGTSAVGKVLNGKSEKVMEMFYLNY